MAQFDSSQLEPKNPGMAEFEGVKFQPPVATKPLVQPVQIKKEIRSWAIWSILLGALHVVLNGFFSAPWGLVLLLVGLASFYFRSAAMLAVYGVTISWAMISNLLSGGTGWYFYAAIQLVIAFQIFRRYARFRKAEAELTPEEAAANTLTPGRPVKIFPWLTISLGGISLLGFVLVIVFAFLWAVLNQGNQSVPSIASFAEGVTVNIGILALAVGMASLLGKYPRRGWVIAGMILGILPLVTELLLNFL